MPSLDRRLFCLGLPACMTVPARAAQTLRVLAWPGYADPDVVEGFERRRQVKVEVTFIDSDEALWQKIGQNEGRDFDVFAVNTAELQRYIAQGRASPIDTTAIPNLGRQLPRFRELTAIPGLVHGNATYGIPYTYSEMGLIYDRRQWPKAPASIAELWNEGYRGKVIAYDGGVHNFSLAAQALGLATPFRLGERDWPRAVDRLIALRRNVASFYTQPEESVALFRQHKAALMFANYGTQQLHAVKAAGIDVGYSIPKEGALAWLDCWAITRAVRDRGLANAWIDYMLGEGPGQALVTRQGLANTAVTPESLRQAANLVWLQPVESEDRRNQMWSRIIAGDRASKVLMP
ncbi:extracellular solute-binding protein [Leptothrix sp. BB-4]